MTCEQSKFRIRVKIWVEDESSRTVFGEGRLKVLQTVQELGSLHAAAKVLGMSYRAVWGRIRHTEERLGVQLLTRNVGGASGGGSQLTEVALALMDEYRRLQAEIADRARERFDEGLGKELGRDCGTLETEV